MYHRAEDMQREQGLRLKNAELRIEAERLCDEYERLQTENEKLQTENMRLRSWISADAKSTRQILRENIELRNLFYEAWE